MFAELFLKFLQLVTAHIRNTEIIPSSLIPAAKLVTALGLNFHVDSSAGGRPDVPPFPVAGLSPTPRRRMHLTIFWLRHSSFAASEL